MGRNIPELNIKFNSFGHTQHDFMRSLEEIAQSFQSKEIISKL